MPKEKFAVLGKVVREGPIYGYLSRNYKKESEWTVYISEGGAIWAEEEQMYVWHIQKSETS